MTIKTELENSKFNFQLYYVTDHFALSGFLWFAIPFSRDHILSELSTITHLSWIALHGMAHSFIELDKAVIHVVSFVSFL